MLSASVRVIIQLYEEITKPSRSLKIVLLESGSRLILILILILIVVAVVVAVVVVVVIVVVVWAEVTAMVTLGVLIVASRCPGK